MDWTDPDKWKKMSVKERRLASAGHLLEAADREVLPGVRPRSPNVEQALGLVAEAFDLVITPVMPQTPGFRQK